MVGVGLDMKVFEIHKPPTSLGIRTLLVFVLILLTACVAYENATYAKDLQPEDNTMAQLASFDALTQLKGKIYLAERNRFIQSQVDLRGSIQSYLLSDAWKTRIQAQIIQGWQEHHQLYVNILSQLDVVNIEDERKTVVGIARVWDMYALRTQQEYHEKILPLAWEVITKYYEDWPSWKVITFLYMIGAAPVEDSIEPVIFLLEETPDPSLKSAAGKTLAKLPRPAVIKQLEMLEAKHKAILQAIQGTRDRFE